MPVIFFSLPSSPSACSKDDNPTPQVTTDGPAGTTTTLRTGTLTAENGTPTAGEFNVWTRAYASSWLGNNAYISADVGYNFRTRGFTNQYTVGGEVGHRFGENLWINATLQQFATAGMPNPNKGSFVSGEGLQYTGYSVGTAYSVSSKISLAANDTNYFGTRKNIYSGPTIGLGLAVQFN